ncbi:MAG: ABC transporter permease [Deltaproteobacteria bacterium]|nr:ABC transporter permease [Deltaproteobacteria bacterium]MBW2307171.1 ABC transporter permease [Deltaproteobacteria bacterium]
MENVSEHVSVYTIEAAQIRWTRRKILRRIWRLRVGILGLLIVLTMMFIAVFAPRIAPYDPYEQNIMNRFQPPFWMPKGTTANLLGTDHVGRDILSRIIYGSRVSLSVGFLAVLIATSIGVTLGIISGYKGGRADTIISFAVNVMMAFPFILLAMVVVAVMGASFQNIFICLGITSWPIYTRLVRAEVMQLRGIDFVTSARATGCSGLRIVMSHIFPNLFSSILVVATVETARAILRESFLSFLGLGIPPPIPSWGGMLSDGRAYMLFRWWLAAFPGFAIFLTALGINLLGDGMRDFLDPHQEG